MTVIPKSLAVEFQVASVHLEVLFRFDQLSYVVTETICGQPNSPMPCIERKVVGQVTQTHGVNVSVPLLFSKRYHQDEALLHQTISIYAGQFYEVAELAGDPDVFDMYNDWMDSPLLPCFMSEYGDSLDRWLRRAVFISMKGKTKPDDSLHDLEMALQSRATERESAFNLDMTSNF